MKRILTLVLAVLWGAGIFLHAAKFAPAQEMDRPAHLVGALVKTQYGEPVGRVVDATVGPDGNIDFLIVARMGMEDRLVPIPYWTPVWSASAPHHPVVMVNLGAVDLRRLPSISRAEWPDKVETGWAQSAYDYFRIS